jgi:hypothetical protein
MNLKELGCQVCVGLQCPQVRDQWRALVNTVVNEPPGFLKDEEFLKQEITHFPIIFP